MKYALFTMVVSMFSIVHADDTRTVIDHGLHHVRNAEPREWSSFPEDASATKYERVFQGTKNIEEVTLQLTQHDVKQAWDILLNDHKLGSLHRDENAIEACWKIPPGTLTDGENTLLISTTSKLADDIQIADVSIRLKSVDLFLKESKLTVTVRDKESGEPSPCRITVLRNDHLSEVGGASNDNMAVRPGVIYCRGTAEFSMPAGSYTVIAGRGPEFGIDHKTVVLKEGQEHSIDFTISREVTTTGFVACDTHVHTLTHSGHGDASIRERMLTLAGECIEFPVATDHNKHIDYEEIAVELGVRSYFTPVIGNEVTTKLGHFNIFPIASSSTPVPDFKADNWTDIFDSIFATPGTRIVILNHGRDVHSGYRPFGPEHHLALTAQNHDGWNLRANAMEVINSAAQQTDMMLLVHDWMAQLNAGRKLTPVGSSDSHDVARHFVGQGRTLIRCDDSDVSNIDVTAAVDNFLAGKVVVSCGLSANIRVNTNSGPGDTVSAAKTYNVEVDAIGPSWLEAHEVELFLNGRSFLTSAIDAENRVRPGIKQTISVQIPVASNQDGFIVAVVRGPGCTDLHWPVAKPYQPTSDNWTPQFMAVTGAVWIDADGDGKFTSAMDYASQVCDNARGSVNRIIMDLERYDFAVAAHAASILHANDHDAFVHEILPLARKSVPSVDEAFESFFEQWQNAQRARSGSPGSSVE